MRRKTMVLLRLLPAGSCLLITTDCGGCKFSMECNWIFIHNVGNKKKIIPIQNHCIIICLKLLYICMRKKKATVSGSLLTYRDFSVVSLRNYYFFYIKHFWSTSRINRQPLNIILHVIRLFWNADMKQQKSFKIWSTLRGLVIK